MQRVICHRIKLLITLVLFTVALAAVWTTNQADARGLSGPGASSVLGVSKPGATTAAGDPDAGAGVSPPPPPTVKQNRLLPGRGNAGWMALTEWIRWAGRIWATIYLRAAN